MSEKKNLGKGNSLRQSTPRWVGRLEAETGLERKAQTEAASKGEHRQGETQRFVVNSTLYCLYEHITYVAAKSQS